MWCDCETWQSVTDKTTTLSNVVKKSSDLRISSSEMLCLLCINNASIAIPNNILNNNKTRGGIWLDNKYVSILVIPLYWSEIGSICTPFYSHLYLYIYIFQPLDDWMYIKSNIHKILFIISNHTKIKTVQVYSIRSITHITSGYRIKFTNSPDHEKMAPL